MAPNSRENSPSPVSSSDAYDMCDLETDPEHSFDHRTTTIAHSACLHRIPRSREIPASGFDAGAAAAESTLIVTISGSGSGSGKEKKPVVGDKVNVLGLLHPRWCARFLQEREASLRAATRCKLVEIARCSGTPAGEKAKKGAYFLQLNHARVEVMKEPLKKKKSERVRVEAKAGGMLEIQMDRMSVGDDAEDTEDMMAGMEEAEIAWSELADRTELHGSIEEYGMHGYNDGRGLQTRLEQEAMYQTNGRVRKHLFDLSMS
ncbi:hypothetical protein LZ554_000499 [Drepanopeziza brunnea f. sp. 'monogermtubi']|nr:hypothetical protein LZ554_000499 [Drepanopeziza brunnea f. sp. 'monogermtubi']